MRIEKLDRPPLIGERYLVRTAIANPGGVAAQDVLVPVFGTRHSDPQLGWIAGSRHIHVDPRFVPMAIIKTLFGAIIPSEESMYPNSDGHYKVPALFDYHYRGMAEPRLWECLREMPDYDKGNLISDTDNQFYKWQEDMAGTSLTGSCRTCPHQKISLNSVPIINGKRTCPGHGLQFCGTTNKLVARKTRVPR